MSLRFKGIIIRLVPTQAEIEIAQKKVEAKQAKAKADLEWLNENVPTDFSEEGKKVAEEIKQFREIPGKEGDEAFSLMIVGSWKYMGEHFEELKLTWPEEAQKACQNDVKLMLDMFRGSNFLSDPNPDHNTARYSTIISLNDNEEDLEDKMDEFKTFWRNN